MADSTGRLPKSELAYDCIVNESRRHQPTYADGRAAHRGDMVAIAGEPGKPNTFELKQRLVYEQAHGVKLTSDDIIVFLDGDKLNCDPSNLVRLSHAEHAKMMTYKLTYSDRETFETALNIMRLNDRVRTITGRERVCPVCGKTFKPTNPNNPSRCCSTKCAGEYRRGKPRKRKESNGTTR